MSKKKSRGKFKPNGKVKPERRAKPKRKGPRSMVLPTMEQARSQRLDNLCEEIAEERETMNGAKVKEKASTASALKAMQERNLTVYKHAGVELARVPGAEKLRVRLVNDDGDASVGEGVTTSTQDSTEQDSATE